MSAMLASVSDVFEAELVLGCGVDWVDIKDPRAGALGAAPTSTIADIVRLVAGRCPVSATIGDSWQAPSVIPQRVAFCAATGVDFVKAGLDARDVAAPDLAAIAAAAQTHPLIVVCNAERPPRARDVAALAGCGIAGIMLDTALKSGPSLTALHDDLTLGRFVAQAKGAGLLCGLAGRLRRDDIARLVPLGADYLGFRSALCAGGVRTDRLAVAAVQDVVATMHAAGVAADSHTATR